MSYRVYAHKRLGINTQDIELIRDSIIDYDLYDPLRSVTTVLRRSREQGASYLCVRGTEDNRLIYEEIDGCVLADRFDQESDPARHGMTIDGEFYTFDELSDSVIDGLEPDHPDSPLMRAGLI